MNQFGDLAHGKYLVYIKDFNNCYDSLFAEVGYQFFVPNIFTPNGDGKNDFFYIPELPDGSKLRVYDRWGILVYQSQYYLNNWNGSKEPDGTYYYELTTNKEIIKGWVQIVR
jgi:gliding motility-associated-like protein